MAFYLSDLSPSNKMIDSDGKIRNMSFDASSGFSNGIVNGKSIVMNSGSSIPSTHTEIRSGWQLYRSETSTKTETIATHEVQLPLIYEWSRSDTSNKHRHDVIHIVGKGFTSSENATQYPIFQISNSAGSAYMTDANYDNFGISVIEGSLSTGQWTSTGQTHGWLVKPQWSPFGVTGTEFSFDQTIYTNVSNDGTVDQVRIVTRAGFIQGSGTTIQRQISGTSVTIYEGWNTGFGPPKYIRYREGANPTTSGTSVLKVNVYVPKLYQARE